MHFNETRPFSRRQCIHRIQNFTHEVIVADELIVLTKVDPNCMAPDFVPQLCASPFGSSPLMDA
jgi:hypothetical protein